MLPDNHWDKLFGVFSRNEKLNTSNFRFGLQKKPANDNLAEWNNGNIFANRFMKNK
jgi:hypothetical protein